MAQSFRCAANLPFRLLKTGPVLVQCLGLLAAKQRVFPFLNLALEFYFYRLGIDSVHLAGHDILVKQTKADFKLPKSVCRCGKHENSADPEKSENPPP